VRLERVTRFCACCGGPVTLVRFQPVGHDRTKTYTDDTTYYHMGKLFLCSEQCWAAVVKGFGAVDAFEEWALSPSSLVGSGVGQGED